MKYVKNQALGIRALLTLGMLLVMAMASADTPASVSAHGGDVSLVHLCVNDTNAETLVVHPHPIGDATIDCVNPPGLWERDGPPSMWVPSRELPPEPG